MGGWVQEVFWSYYQMGLLAELGCYPREAATTFSSPEKFYLKAFSLDPERLEPLYQLSELHRSRGDNSLCYKYAKVGMGLGTSSPSESLFADNSMGRRLRDEMCICAYYEGKYREGREACEWLLKREDLSQEDRARTTTNLSFYLQVTDHNDDIG